MRALVTGATGFLGSYVTDLLLRRGAHVAVLLRKSSDPWRIQHSLSRVRVLEGDLRHLQAMADEIQAFRPHVIFHLAWSGVGNQFRDDPSQVEENLFSSVSLVRLAIATGCDAWVGIGSQAEYGPQNRVLDETAPTNPTTTYGAVKLCVGTLARQLAAGTSTRVAWLRLFSTYGPKDNPDWMIPYLIKSIRNGRKPSLTGCEQRWDYLFIEDAAQAVYQVGITPSAEGTFNLGSGQSYVLRDLIEMLRDQIDPRQSLGIGDVPYRPDQVMHLQADITRLQRLTGWKPLVSIEEGFKRTVDWYDHAKLVYD